LPDVLHLKPEEIDTPEKRAQFTVCVVGCGQTGAFYALAFAEAGFRVACADADQSLLKKFVRGKPAISEQEMESKLKNHVRSGRLSTTDDLTGAVTQSAVVLLTGGARVDEKERLDFSEVESSCKQVGAGLQRGALVVFVGLAGFGFTEGVVKETLEGVSGLKSGADFGLAYVQEESRAVEPSADMSRNSMWMVAANDKASLDAASLILPVATRGSVTQIMNVKVAELAVLFASARKNVSAALLNEFAVFCEKAGVDVFEVLKFMNHGLHQHGYCPIISDDARKHATGLLLESAENLDVKLRLPKLAVQVNDDIVRHAVNLVQGVLRDCGKTLRRARIAVLGETTRGASEMFVKLLLRKGARINAYSSRGVKDEGSTSLIASKRSLVEAVESCDCIVILTAEEQFRRLNLKSLRSLMKTPAAVVDLVSAFEREKVESEGFLYRGLGRGVERK
jgi:UDP-N-acetyl-D-mannosaminuronic acid dehydrogenase